MDLAGGDQEIPAFDSLTVWPDGCRGVICPDYFFVHINSPFDIQPDSTTKNLFERLS
jgi:hypothetical protein